MDGGKRSERGKGSSSTTEPATEAAIVDQHGAQLRGLAQVLSIQKGAAYETRKCQPDGRVVRSLKYRSTVALPKTGGRSNDGRDLVSPASLPSGPFDRQRTDRPSISPMFAIRKLIFRHSSFPNGILLFGNRISFWLIAVR